MSRFSILITTLATVAACTDVPDDTVLVTVRSQDPSIVGRDHWTVSGTDAAEVVGTAIDGTGGEVTLAVDRALCGTGQHLLGTVAVAQGLRAEIFSLRTSDCAGETEPVAAQRPPGGYIVSAYNCSAGDYPLCSSTGVLWCYSATKDVWYTKGTCSIVKY